MNAFEHSTDDTVPTAHRPGGGLAGTSLRPRWRLGVVALLLLGATAAQAKSPSELEQGVVACAAIDDSARRLACFDELAESMTPATAEPGTKYLEDDGEDTQDAVLTLSLVEAKKDARGRWLFYFANGQVWRQLEKGYLALPTQRPAAAQLSQGVFGSYTLLLGERGNGVKVKRIK